MDISKEVTRLLVEDNPIYQQGYNKALKDICDYEDRAKCREYAEIAYQQGRKDMIAEIKDIIGTYQMEHILQKLESEKKR